MEREFLETRRGFAYATCCQLIEHELQIVMADKEQNMVGNVVHPRENEEDDAENSVDGLDEVEEIGGDDAEFKNLNDQLDQLNVILDSLESKNDNIHAELIKLLNSNREARKQFQESSHEDLTKKKEEAQS